MSSSNTQKKRIFQLVAFLILAAATVWIIRRHNTAYQSNSGPIFGTTYKITYQSPSDFHPEIQTEMKKVDAALSLFNPDSWLSRYNAGQNPASDKIAKDVITLAMRVSKDTQGAFDITVAPLVNAWGFGNEKTTTPSDEQIDSLLSIVGYQRYLRGERVMLDCGAIAKGYAVDRVANLLRMHGVKNFMVEIGGEIVAEGCNSEGKPWQIGVARPTHDRSELQEILPFTHVAMATSGNYRNYRTDSKGNRYAHTIDPRLGRPVQQTLLSATIIAPTCAEADAYATASMVMGREDAEKLLSKKKDIQYYYIYADGSSCRVSTNIKGLNSVQSH